MDKEEILERNKLSFPEDEGEEYVEMRARKFGEIGLVIVLTILMVYKMAMHMPCRDILAILWVYEGSMCIYYYKYYKTKKYLYYAIALPLSALAYIILDII